LSGRRAKKPIHDGSQKNELNGYTTFKYTTFKASLARKNRPAKATLYNIFGLYAKWF
jgi:hypothetical protein